MALTKKALEKMTDEALVAEGEKLDLKIDLAVMSRNSAIDLLLAENTPVVEAEEAEDAEEPVKPTNKKFRIIVHHQEGIDASKFVKVQVNGVMYTLPRETEVEVPEAVLSVLNDAVQTVFVYEDGKLVERSARRFPYTTLGEVK